MSTVCEPIRILQQKIKTAIFHPLKGLSILEGLFCFGWKERREARGETLDISDTRRKIQDSPERAYDPSIGS